jgi:prepilin-type N-terminal cleavage/methylation domain-containing protein
MRRAFTLVELLVVMAIITILASILMPILTRARVAAQVASCQHNLHNIGLALAMARSYRRGGWPRMCEEGQSGIGFTTVAGRLTCAGLLPECDVFTCPVSTSVVSAGFVTDSGTGLPVEPPWWPDSEGWPPVWWGGIREPGSAVVTGSRYSVDNGRIHKNSKPGRAILADNLQAEWYPGCGGAHIGQPYVGANHVDDSANVLFVDNAVIEVLPAQQHLAWQVDASRDVWRRGYMQNPRLDIGDDPMLPAESDVLQNAPGGADDHDDMYAIDSDTQANTFYLYSDPDFDMCPLSTTRAQSLDREDANLQPERGFLHYTGWPQAAW